MIEDRPNAVITAFTEEQTERLTGVSQRQLRYWAKASFFISSLLPLDDEAGIPALRLYSFRDLVCLKVISALRNEAKIPLNHLREVKTRLAHLGDDLWATTTLYVFDRKVVFDNPATGQKEEALSGQGVLRIPLLAVTGNMQEAIQTLRRRGQAKIGQLDFKRGGQKNPTIAGTRISVRTIQDFAQAGYSTAEIVEQYPSLTDDDIRAALRFKAVA